MSETRVFVVQRDAQHGGGEWVWSVWAVSGEAVSPDCGLKLRQVRVDIPLEYVGDAISVDIAHHPEEAK